MKYIAILSLVALPSCNFCSPEEEEEQEHFGPNPGGNGPIKPPQS